MNETLLMDLVDRVKHRFLGKFRGTVTDVDAATMRIRATIPAVLGSVTSGWCEACVPYAGPAVGFIMLPEVGSGVWIEFEGGDVSYPIWVGCYWRSGEIPADASATAKAIFAKSGVLKLDDDASKISLEDADGDSLTLSSGTVTIKSDKGKIVADTTGVAINDTSLVVT
ncbi:phage baseplate assembly protein V [Novosphingobium lentum]|uniref:phage baseplate assembly protein V n=1 Tax=Novosphingobium lentum TaxID=145287 RepID=UPI00082C2D92|nr:phage baseplate assembly protein V [Novosphingobium lentum]